MFSGCPKINNSKGLWSQDCISFLSYCTKKKPSDRPPTDWLLKHPWLVKCGNDTNTTRLVSVIEAVKKLKESGR